MTPVTRKTREEPSAMTAKTAPSSTPPMTIWIARFISNRSVERDAGWLADDFPDVLGRRPARHHGVGDVEAALRRRGEIIDAIDAGITLGLGERGAQLRRAR